ncbi:MAG TPA: phosphomannomutase/phosphoglucomutase [Stellaceae bacterium]|nr:phosphomannomutase/phosphoglucomutase [Stellaceae bacterium]
MGHRFDPTVLREYDIRGVVGKTLFAADARAIGRAFAAIITEAGGMACATGYDGRLSSPELEEALVEGLAEGGLDVLRVGLGPTPMLYYAAATEAVDGGIMVTGSHNPPDYNGFKFVLGGKAFFGPAIQRLGEIAAAGAAPARPRGRTESRELAARYVARLLADYDGERPLKVAWDPGNGATGAVVEALTRALPGRHTLINATIDGTFPAHHPDPTIPENLAQLIATVRREGCDLGIAFDGDGDRIGVVEERGRILWGDQLMIVFAEDILRRHPGAPIIADVKSSQVLFDEIARLGGRPVMTATGHSPIKARLAELKAPLAGEMSGHLFFADRYYGFDDAVYAAVRLVGLLARGQASLGDILDRLPKVVNTPELRFPCPEARKFEVVREVARRLRAMGAPMTEIDGVRVTRAEGWWLLRASNTQDVLVARVEAADEEGLARLEAELAAELEASGLALPPVPA